MEVASVAIPTLLAQLAPGSAYSSESEHLAYLIKENDAHQKEVQLYTQFLLRNRQPLVARVSSDEGVEYVPLTFDEKCEVASAEVEAASSIALQAKNEGETKVTETRILLQQVEDNVSQLERETADFKRSFLRSPQTAGQAGRVSADKLMAYLESQLRSKEALLEKLGIKLTVTKDYGKKLESQLELQKASGESVGAVDYEKLKIENTQQSEMIRDRNSELPRLRLSAGKAAQALRSQRMTLKGILKEIHALQIELQEQQQQTLSLEASASASASAASTLQSSKSQSSKSLIRAISASDRELPSEKLAILDYVKLTKQNQELNTQVTELERKYRTALALSKKVMNGKPLQAETFKPGY